MPSTSVSTPSLPSPKQSPTGPAQPSALFLALASRSARKRYLNEPRYKLFWQTVAVAASMLMFAALRPSTTEITAGGTAQSIRIYSSSKELPRTDSRMRFQQAEVWKARDLQLHSMAKDFTNQSNQRAHSIATMQKSEGRHNAQGDVIPTRVVFN